MARVPSDAIVLSSIPLAGAVISLDNSGVPRSTIQVAKTGNWPHSTKRKGGFSLTSDMLRQMKKNAERSSTEIPVDYNHLSIRVQTPDDGIAAGWHESYELRNNDTELFALTRWTPKAAKHIENQEFRYISPTFLPSVTNPTDGTDMGAVLLCSALTNTPFLKGMQPVELSELEHLGIINLIDSGDFSFDEKKSRVREAVSKKFELSSEYVYVRDIYDDFVVVERGGRSFQLTYSFGSDGKVTLGEELTEVVQTYTPIAASTLHNSGVKTVMADQNNNDLISLRADLDKVTGLVTGLQGNVTALTSENNALKEQLANERGRNRVSQLIQEGKILPKQREAMEAIACSNIDLFEKMAATFEPAIALNQERGVRGDNKPPKAGEKKTETKTTKTETTSSRSAESIGQEGDEGEADEEVNLSEMDPDAVIALTETKVTEYIKANGGKDKVRYADAMRAVFAENPGLDEAYRGSFETVR